MNAAAGLMLALAIFAADPVEEARELYDAGSEAYRQGQYEVAINAFEAAYKLAPRAPVVFSLAQSCRLQYFIDGDRAKLERAVTLYREYIGMVEKGGRRDDAAQLLSTLVPIYERLQQQTERVREPGSEPITAGRVIVASRVEGATARVDGGDPQRIPATFEMKPGEHRILVEAPDHQPKTLQTVAVAASVVALNVELDELPGQIKVIAPEGSSVLIDGRRIGSSPIAEPIELRAGRHTIAVTERGHEPFVETLELGRGQSARVEAELEVTTQRLVSYGLAAGALVAFAAAGVAGGFAVAEESPAIVLEEKRENKMSLTEEEANAYARYESRRDDYVGLAAGAAIAGTAAAVTAVLVYLFDEPEAPRMPVLAPMRAGGTFSIEF